MRIVFFGTPSFSVPFLEALIDDKAIEIVGVVTQPSKPVGRKKELVPSAVKVIAKEHGLPVFEFERIKSKEALETITNLHADLFVVVAYGKIIPISLLDLPKFGAVNVHPSLLPKYRGPSPRQSAILHGDMESGVTIIKLDREMDHGPILAQFAFPLDSRETMQTLEGKIFHAGPKLLVATIHALENGTLTPREQNHAEAIICSMLTREDGIIDWKKSSEEIDRMYRAFYPWPGVSCLWNRFGKPLSLKIHELRPSELSIPAGSVRSIEGKLYIGSSTTALEILSVQPESKSKMSAKDFLNGYPDFLETTL
ncbi:MAG: methionyl-tRNA formyltransferase [Patescibacteria group bacterium]|jgi:methionyl-tRNA formyltransferase